MKYWRTALLIIIDIFLVNMGYLIAINMTDVGSFTEIAEIYSQDCIAVSIIYLVCFLCFKLYHSLWDLTGTDEFILGVGGCILAGLITIAYTRFFGATIPLNVSVMGIIIIMVSVLGLRILYRIYRRMLLYMPYKNSSDQKRVLIVGAGSAGTMIINEMLARREMKYNPVILVDDSQYKKGKRISGVKVVGNRYDIPDLVKEYEIDVIIIAIPTLETEEKTEIINICKKNCS